MTQRRDRDRWPRRALRPLAFMALATALAAVPTIAFAGAGAAGHRRRPRPCSHGRRAGGRPPPTSGRTCVVFDPSMPQAEIQAKVDAVAAQQVGNEMGSARYALLFAPGTYGSADAPAELPGGLLHRGRRPGTRTRATSSSTARSTSATSAAATGLHRPEQLLALDVQPHDQRDQPRLRLLQRRVLGRVAGGAAAPGARQGPDHAHGLLHRALVRQWRVHRRLALRRSRHQRVAAAVLHPQQRASTAGATASGTRSSPAPRARRPSASPAAAACGGPYTTVAKTSVSREKPYLYTDSSGAYRVFVPAAATDSSGVTWALGLDAGPLDRRSATSSSPSPRTRRRRSTVSSPAAGTCC